jgi:hypothetical protein
MAKIKFSAQLGALLRGQFRRSLKSYCFSRGYTLDLVEDKGFLESLYNVTISVPDNKANEAWDELSQWMNGLTDDK